MLDDMAVSKPLVIAPLRVARDTWPAKIWKWEHLSNLDNTDGGNRTIIGGVLEFTEGAQVRGFPGASNMTPKTTNTAADIRNDLNILILNLKNAWVMIPDAWNLSVLAVPTPASMPTTETAANSGHATVTIDGTEIIITLDCMVADLADADHGETWGSHKLAGIRNPYRTGVRGGRTVHRRYWCGDHAGFC